MAVFGVRRKGYSPRGTRTSTRRVLAQCLLGVRGRPAFSAPLCESHRAPAGKLQMHILGAIAECERARIAERVRAGLARAQAQGRRLGRPKRVVGETVLAPVRGLSVRQAAARLGVSAPTGYAGHPAESESGGTDMADCVLREHPARPRFRIRPHPTRTLRRSTCHPPPARNRTIAESLWDCPPSRHVRPERSLFNSSDLDLLLPGRHGLCLRRHLSERIGFDLQCLEAEVRVIVLQLVHEVTASRRMVVMRAPEPVG